MRHRSRAARCKPVTQLSVGADAPSRREWSGRRRSAKMRVLALQSGWTIDKFPRQPESFRHMRSERSNAKHLCRVMSAEEEIHAEFFGGNRGPMRRFTSDERVDSFACDSVNFRARGSGHNAYRARLFRTEIENFYLT